MAMARNRYGVEITRSKDTKLLTKYDAKISAQITPACLFLFEYISFTNAAIKSTYADKPRSPLSISIVSGAQWAFVSMLPPKILRRESAVSMSEYA